MNEVLEQEIEALLERHIDHLGRESVAAIRHYLDRDEQELAAEGLILDLLKIGSTKTDWQSVRRVAVRANLNESRVFDDGLWDKLLAQL